MNLMNARSTVLVHIAKLSLVVLVACGSRTSLNLEVESEPLVRPVPSPEVCNRLDDDLNGLVDDPFRDALGRYVDLDHCGVCDAACRPQGRELEVTCGVIEETARCIATLCEDGFAPSRAGGCVPLFDSLCLPCVNDGDCGEAVVARCEDIGGETRCSVGCEFGCPDGYECREVDDEDGPREACVPSGGSCTCTPGDRFDLACALEDPDGLLCPGASECDDGILSECLAPAEVCDEVDNDCDGLLDEGFRDDRGAYILDIQHCGECGVDCTESEVPEGDLICGGDPFAPSCVLLCPDTEDGLMPGDRLDADRDIATGCECVLGALDDQPGPVGAEGDALDVNCDGADGIVLESIYVATDGDDANPGSPTRPLRTINAAIELATSTLGTDAPRRHIFIASGAYAETVSLADGVLIHGGYRRDFRELSPDGFRVEIRGETDALGGAGVVGDEVGERETVLEWVEVRGADAALESSAAFGIVLRAPRENLALRSLTVRSGAATAGRSGLSGSRGVSPEVAASEGAPPRAAIEDAGRTCRPGPENVVSGGTGGRHSCDGTTVDGGDGGSPTCPMFADTQDSGTGGRAVAGAAGGSGGRGGQDSRGPIMGISCSEPVCCGLADFTVPSRFEGPQSGTRGGDGAIGSAGAGCRDPFGRFSRDGWVPAENATRGTDGSPGAGGGGGGAGGGAEMTFFDDVCEFPDGLGGGGGGGGAGACGGEAGSPGRSGGPSAAILIYEGGMVTISDVTVAPGDGGDGGDGGAGGDGGRGGIGALGGELARELRSTPTLSGPFPGGRGGRGGDGGAGGAGGGGCGGGSIGIWYEGTSDAAFARWRADNEFILGRPGRAGRGGGGAAAAADGQEGGALDVVLVR